MRIWINQSIKEVNISKEIMDRGNRKVWRLTIIYNNNDRITTYLTIDDYGLLLKGMKEVDG